MSVEKIKWAGGAKPSFCVFGEQAHAVIKRCVNTPLPFNRFKSSPLYDEIRMADMDMKATAVGRNLERFSLVLNAVAAGNSFYNMLVDFKTHQPILILRTHEGKKTGIRTIVDERVGFALEGLSPDVWVISDYDEGMISDEDIKKIFEFKKNTFSETQIYVQTRRKNVEIFKDADVVILSEKDFENSVGSSSIENLIVTLGADGASYKDKIYPTTKLQRTNPYVGREAFFAAFAYVYFRTRDFDKSIKYANEAAAEVVAQPFQPLITKETALRIKKEIGIL